MTSQLTSDKCWWVRSHPRIRFIRVTADIWGLARHLLQRSVGVNSWQTGHVMVEKYWEIVPYWDKDISMTRPYILSHASKKKQQQKSIQKPFSCLPRLKAAVLHEQHEGALYTCKTVNQTDQYNAIIKARGWFSHLEIYLNDVRSFMI